MHDIHLTGPRIRLRPLAPGDRDRIVAIRTTEEVFRRWRGEDLHREFDDDMADDEVFRFAIEDESGMVNGLIQFGEEDDPDYRSANVDIFLDPSIHRRGYASEAINVLCNYLFDERGHHRLTIDPAADNEAAIACYAKAGFRPVGVMRAYEARGDGSWADGLLMDMLATDRF